MRVLFCVAGLAMSLPAMSVPAMAEKLTIDRIYSDPDLNGPSPRALKLAPDGSRVTFLRGREDDQNQLDLWVFDVATNTTHRLVDSTALGKAPELSDAEKARRERERIAQLHGIVSYRWSPDSKKILFGVGERLWLYDFAAKPGAELRALTPSGLDVIDAQVSPKGRYVSFVSRQNLYTVDLETGKNYQLTRDGKGPIHNGEAEFVAQEEMDRATGYWWAPDDSLIAFERYDESGVDEIKRNEVYADRTETVSQRYPAAGRPNVSVRLGLVRPHDMRARWVDLAPDPGRNADIYLARVNWLPDASALTFQRETRDQQTLDLVSVDAGSLHHRTLLTETSKTWINLNDDLRFLKHEDAFVWASEESGHKHLYVIGLDGRKRRELTAGDWDVDKVLALDESGGTVYFTSGRDDPLQQQVYAARLDGASAATPRRISAGEGWHEAEFGEGAQAYVDTYSDPVTPPQVSLRKPDGALIAWIEPNALKEGHPYWPYRESLIEPEYGSLKADDGQALLYRMYKPADFDAKKKYPVFMTYYGGPGRQYVNRAWGNHFEQYMAQQGYVVFALDNRGSPRRGRAFSDAIFRQLGKAEVADQLAGVAWLKQQRYVDGDRIGVFGWSYGGYMTLMLLAKGSDQIAAGVAVAPVTDWTLYDTHYTERYLDTPQRNPNGYELSNVFHWLDGLKSHLLLVHGMADDNVLFANSTKLMADLQNRETQFRLMTYPGGKHGLSTPAMRKHVYTLISSYFDEMLKRPEQQRR
ncbi:MAG TPA: alpha/beta fold hydrolase [Rhodanobacteraceae bacterium]